jgi:anti-sigma factor (TIGR02949 family)
VDPLDRTVAGLSCREVLYALSDYLDGALDAGTLHRVQQHLAGCEQCARFGGRVSSIIDTLRTTTGAVRAPEAALQRLHSRLAAMRE